MTNPSHLLIVGGVMMLASVAIVSYWMIKASSRWRHTHWFGKAAIVTLALMAANHGRHPFDDVAIKPVETAPNSVTVTLPEYFTPMDHFAIGMVIEKYAEQVRKRN